jgi:LAO/AO transport system kinase
LASGRLTAEEYAAGIISGNRMVLARGITLMESTLPSDMDLAAELLHLIHPHTGNSVRIGITGVPGVGKSTFIDAFGTYITHELKGKVAVLAVDPSSSKSRGSILGDKTRMYRLANDPAAFIRPTASGGTLGGVASRSRETILLCEAAGYDHILVETVGVGQSETTVYELVDFFLLLMLAGAGDELQGIKRGIMELCHALVINKADGDNMLPARKAAAEYASALHLIQSHESGWIPKTGTCSALLNEGMDAIMEWVYSYRQKSKASGFFDENRKRQQWGWMDVLLKESLYRHFYEYSEQHQNMDKIREDVMNGRISVRKALQELLDSYFKRNI